MTTPQITRTKTRIDLLVDRIIETLVSYPTLSINAVAVASSWTQSSFLRACESREISLPEREGRASIESLLSEYAKARDFDSITLLMDAVDHMVDAQTCFVEEPPAKEPAPKKVSKKAQKALDEAAAADEATDEEVAQDIWPEGEVDEDSDDDEDDQF